MSLTYNFRSSIEDVLNGLTQVFPDSRDRVQKILSLLPLIGYNAATNSIENTPYPDNSAYLRRMLLAYLGLSTAAITFQSSNEALDLVQQVNGPLLAEVDYTGGLFDGAVFDGIVSLRAAILNDIQTRGSALPDLVTFSTPTTLPSAVVSYLAYGDGSRGDEIVLRNNPINPLFCSTTNEILSS